MPFNTGVPNIFEPMGTFGILDLGFLYISLCGSAHCGGHFAVGSVSYGCHFVDVFTTLSQNPKRALRFNKRWGPVAQANSLCSPVN